MAKSVKKGKSPILTPEVKAILDIYHVDMKRYVGALAEDFQSKVVVIAEHLGEINLKLDSHSEMIAQLMVDVSEIKNNLKTKVSYDDFAKLERRLRIVETKLARR